MEETFNFPEIATKMNYRRAKRIKELRVDHDFDLRELAYESSEEWGEDACWKPRSNQLAGRDLCIFAAKFLNEDPDKDPWI